MEPARYLGNKITRNKCLHTCSLFRRETLKKVFCIGETLIDFIPIQKEKSLKEVTGFERVAGGAPMNVAIVMCKIRLEFRHADTR